MARAPLLMKEEVEREAYSRRGQVRSGWTANLIISTFLVTLGSFNFGYNITSVNTPASVFYECSETSKTSSCFPVSEGTWGLVVSMLCVGALIGSLATGSLANRFGRRNCLLALNIPYILGTLLMALAWRSWMLILGRFIIGLGVGASCMVIPMFLSECCRMEQRGQITSAHQLMISIGLMTAELVALGGLASPGFWRIMFGLSGVPALISLLGILFGRVQESPRYLVQQGNLEGAARSLQFYRQQGYDAGELEEMAQAASESDKAEADTWGFLRLIQSWSLAGRSLCIASLLHLAQQFSGINAVFYFSSVLFNTEGSTSSSTSTVPAAISALNLVMTLLSIWLVERMGRRPLVLSSSLGMVVAGSVFTLAHRMAWRTPSVLAVLAYVASFAFGMGPIPWLMMNELFPTQAIAAAVSLAVATNWGCNFLVGVTFSYLRDLLGAWLFVPYIVFTAGFAAYAWFALPETKGRPIGFL